MRHRTREREPVAKEAAARGQRVDGGDSNCECPRMGRTRTVYHSESKKGGNGDTGLLYSSPRRLVTTGIREEEMQERDETE